ncbi:MAG: hypothetical protein F4077_03525 [Gammaproteobacteria bacterium]|nr:hypothetical protein [Gammaproteobacteria bacterium]MYI76821.1 hypothetical protein [Gammaproteobacteria bacterium]
MDFKKLQIGTLVALCLVAICLSVIATRISMVAIDSQQNQTPTPTQSQIPTPTETATITAMVERVNASVVKISATEPADFVLNSVHWRPKSSREQEGRYDLGTGVVIDAVNGYVVTVQHVIRESKGIVVTLYDGRDFEATEVGYDSPTDIAVLKIETDNLQALTFGDSDKVQVGDSGLSTYWGTGS